MKLPRIVASGTLAVLLAAGSGRASIKVVTSIHPISAIVREIGGSKVEVTTLVPAGSDPHDLDLTPRKARAIYEADVIFLIGGRFDMWVLPGSGEELGKTEVVDFHKAFEDSLIQLGNAFNPHFWLDPLYAERIGDIVARTLCSLDTLDCPFFEEHRKSFDARIDSLNVSISRRLRESGFKDFVAFHPAWAYFARRYGLHEAATLEASEDYEPSAKHIAEIVRMMKADHIRFIIAEEFSNPGLAEAVAAQTGAHVIVLDPLGGARVPGRNTYEELLDYDVSIIVNAVRKE
jgi:zinc transport system substrate-binding protein